MLKKIYLTVFILLQYTTVLAQEQIGASADSLLKRKYVYLAKAIEANENDSVKAKMYVRAWIRKAKSEKDFKQLTHAYKTILYISEKKHWIEYADSMLLSSKQSSDNVLIGGAYLTKATIFYNYGENKKALDNFISADKYIVKTQDKNSIFKVKFGIAQTKYYLGFYDEALALFKECLEYFKEENDRAYLNTLHALGSCYNKVGKYSLSTATNHLGITEGIRLEDITMQPYFNHSEGVNQYCLKNYKIAINLLNESLLFFIKNKDFATETVSYYYLGKCYWQLKKYSKAVDYFKKVDAVYDNHHYIRPDLREGYELLIDYYKKTNDQDSQLRYINKLLTIDQLLNQNYHYLIKRMVKEYDTRKLLEAKAAIEQTMNFRTSIGLVIFGIMAIVIAFLVSRHFKNKRRFEELMKRSSNKTDSYRVTTESSKPIQDINPELEANILKQLEKFERNKRYLEKDMNLVKMASLLNTNTKYVSKIIAKHRGKGTIEYITTLKIEHIIELLKTENKYRNYTNKALGEEAGFGSTQNFTRAFKAQTDISPTYFIYELNKSFPLSK